MTMTTITPQELWIADQALMYLGSGSETDQTVKRLSVPMAIDYAVIKAISTANVFGGHTGPINRSVIENYVYTSRRNK